MKSFFIRFLSLGTALVMVIQISSGAQTPDPVEYVNPFIGTDFFGHTFPGASLPFAMVHLSPDMNTQGWTFASGYAYSENSIMGFSHLHWSGVGMVNGGEILIMPTVGDKLQVVPGPLDNPDAGYRSRFDHSSESASPGYYSVFLKDYRVKAELTSTRRAGFHRYTFPESNSSKIILDLGHQIGGSANKGLSELKIVNNNRIEGVKSGDLGKVFFVAEFSKPFAYYGTFDAGSKTPESGGSIWPYKNGEDGINIGAFVYFRTSENEQILVKVGISYTSIEGAGRNLDEEIPHWDFDRTRKEAREIWRKELSRIIIDGATDDQKEIFYTSMYHSLLSQYISQDADGKYLGPDKKIHEAKGYDFYGSFSCWDTYRSQHPLLTLTAPDHVDDFIKSIAAKTRDYGWLPAQHFQNVFGEAMVGDHLIPVIVDAYMKGYRDFDVKFLYEAMRKKALEAPKPPVPSYAGRSGLSYYMELGYTPYDKVTESVPNTLELAYDDWCIALLAKELGRNDDYELFMKRAHNYQNLWDSKTRFMRPRKSDGSWLEELNGRDQEIVKEGEHSWYKYFDPLLVGRRPNRHYTESNAWQYIWAVQHDVQGLINLFGGNKAFTEKLDTFFEMSPNITPPKYVGVVGTIGQYVQGNQPSHHVAYLYDYAGEPWKTQQRVRQICEELYRTGPGGLCGNEDMGSFSSWYVLSSMGFYPVTPGSTSYAIGSPQFGKVSINTGNGKTFVIEARRNSSDNKYIQSATLNGKPITRTWLSQKEITDGGILVFEMGPEPNKKWGSKPEDAPPSMTKISNIAISQNNIDILSVPAGDKPAVINIDGTAILPSGRFLTPAGDLIRITGDPFGMAVAPDGRKAVTIHNGVFTIIDLKSLDAVRIPGYDKKIKSPLSNGSFLGVAFSKDSRKVYLSGGDNGAVIIYNVEDLSRLDSVSLNGVVDGIEFNDSFTSDLVLNEAGNELLVLDRGNFRMVRIDLSTNKLTSSIKVGRQPFGLTLSPDGKTAFVANVGMYEYPLITGATPANYNSLMISHHPYGDNTSESVNGTIVEGRNIPGVGSPLNPDAMSVFTIDLQTNRILDKFKTGYQIGHMIEDAEVVGGASPNSIAAGNQFAYVSNATNDNISVIDYKNHRITGHIPILVDRQIDKYRGLLPFGLTLSRDEKTLYVALLGFNAVAVIDVQSGKTKGLIPSGWGPTRVKLSKDEKEIYITTCRGLGAGPNGGKDFVSPEQGSFVSDIQLGSFQRVPIPDDNQLASYTRQSVENTFKKVTVTDDGKNPLPPLPDFRNSPIKYIVYITKENRTYDEVFGQLKNADGDSTLARFGVNNEYTLPDSLRAKLPGMKISPNHLKAARQFSFSDNYYCDSDASIHGHHWMLGVIPNEWVEANSSVTKTAKIFSKAPGRRYPGSTGSMDPEDYAEIGGLWEALDRKKIPFYNFGEANETAHVREEWYDTNTGAAHGVMVPMQKALFNRTSHDYAGFNMNIPDQYRMDQFEKEFTARWIKGKEMMPSLITMQVPNDHGAKIRPQDGYLYPSSFMADNDLAVGRILHFLSRTKYWKNMLVIITEDDPQGGVDHVDAHRSILMMAGPYVKRGYVSHTHANFGSILKTIYNILNVPYVNQFDVTGSLLQDFFTPVPDYSPFTMELNDSRVFNAEMAMKKYNRTIDWLKIEQGPPLDNEDVERAVHYNK